MIIDKHEYSVNGITYVIRSATEKDAEQLSNVRLQVDGETENLDREPGEGYIDASGFEQIIKSDTENQKSLFLVAAVHDRIVGFSRCEGNRLHRFSHKAEFGVCVLKEFWGYRMGRNLLLESIAWADANEVAKIALHVLETNDKAIKLYEEFGFEIEGLLKKDKLLSDGKYYNTLVMGRIKK